MRWVNGPTLVSATTRADLDSAALLDHRRLVAGRLQTLEGVRLLVKGEDARGGRGDVGALLEDGHGESF